MHDTSLGQYTSFMNCTSASRTRHQEEEEKNSRYFFRLLFHSHGIVKYRKDIIQKLLKMSC